MSRPGHRGTAVLLALAVACVPLSDTAAGLAGPASGRAADPGTGPAIQPAGAAADGTEGTEGTMQPHVLREGTVTVSADDWASMCDTRRDPVSTLVLRPFPDATVHAEADHVDYDEENDVIEWSGHVLDAAEHHVVLHVEGACRGTGAQLSGRIDQGETAFVLSSLDDGLSRVREVDMRGEIPPDVHDAPVPPELRGLNRSLPAAADPGPTAVVDVTPVFTPKAAEKAAGMDGMEAAVGTIEALANKSLADSGVTTFRFHFNDPSVVSYGGKEDPVTVLNEFNSTSTVQGEAIRELREEQYSDLVAVFSDAPRSSTGSFTTGIAYTGKGIGERPQATAEYAFLSAQDLTAALDFNTAAHEMGHNLDLMHDDVTLSKSKSTPDPAYPDAVGWVLPSQKFHTNLAYNSACAQPCTKVFRYSAPEQTYRGEPLGGKKHDNAGTIARTGPIAAGYRTPPEPPARFTLDVRTDPAGGGTAAGASVGPYEHGTQVAVAATPKAGYVFSGWTLDGKAAGKTNPTTVRMTANHTLTARFTKGATASYTVETSVSPGSSGGVALSPKKSTYGPGDSVVATAKPAKGYRFQEWRLDGRQLGTAAQVTVPVDRSMELRGVFRRGVHSLTLSARPKSGGSVKPSEAGPYANGESVVVAAKPRKQRKFTGWKLNGKSLSASRNPVTLVMKGDGTLVGKFSCKVRSGKSKSIGKKWRSLGGQGGRLGCPVAKAKSLPVRDGKPTGRKKLPRKGNYQRFEHGLLIWDAKKKKVVTVRL